MGDNATGPDAVDPMAVLRREVAELREAVVQRPSGKDFWDKVGPFSTLFSSVVLGLAGLMATHFFNENELQLKEADRQRELLRLERESSDKARLQQTQALDRFLHYVASEKPAEREFGYAMFAAFGQADLALKLIALQKDQAGAQVAANLRNDPNEAVRTAARQALLTLDQARSIRTLLRQREGGFFRGGRDIGYGLWSLRGQSLALVLHAYVDKGGRLSDQVAPFLDRLDRQDASLATDDAFAGTLRAVFEEPSMRPIEDAIIDQRFLDPALKLAERNGVKLPLSIAILFDTIVQQGSGTAERLTRQTSEAMSGSPAQGVDEHAWTARYLQQRRNGYQSLVDRSSALSVFLPGWMARIATYEKMIGAGDWQLVSGAPAPAPQ